MSSGTVRFVWALCGLAALIAGSTQARAQDAAALAPWAMTSFDVTQTVPSVTIVETTKLTVAANGDARIAVDINSGKERRRGTILLVAGRWMATHGLTLQSGSELDLMDIAAMNSQLVMTLLRLTLPEGPPQPGAPARIDLKDQRAPVRVATTSASGEYGAPWSASGTASVAAAGGPVSYQLDFKFKTREDEQEVHLKGQVSRPDPPVTIPDSEPLAGWTVYSIGPGQKVSRDGRAGYGAQPAPAAATVGDLRQRK
jgi:hypothetical protein